MKPLTLFLFLSLSLAGFGQTTTLTTVANGISMNTIVTSEKNYNDSTGFYVIRFDYDDSWWTIPATYPPGPPHYDATITVYQIKDGKKEVLGEPFVGFFTDGKCYEDEPGYLVRKAKVLDDPELKEGYLEADYSDPIWDYITDGTPIDSIPTELPSSGTLFLTPDSTLTFASLYAIPDPILTDTIPVVMLVSDTIRKEQGYWTPLGNGLIQKETVSVVSNEIWQMEGYLVTETKEHSIGYWKSYYLDQNKKPLNLCVWETKERREK